VQIIAKGLNPNNGGGEIVIKNYNNENAVLSTGSIKSGVGLGNDEALTKIIINFIDRNNK